MKPLTDWIAPPGGWLEDFYARRFLGAQWHMRMMEQRTQSFEEYQRNLLELIIRQNEGTQWGRDHGFARLTADDWGKMPVVTYEQVEPYVQKIREGHCRALTAEPAQSLAFTSGTTGQAKLVPYTATFIRQEQKSGQYWSYLLKKNAAGGVNRALFLRGDMAVPQTEILPIRSYLSLTADAVPRCVRRRLAIPHCLRDITDFEHRFLIAAQCTFIRRPRVIVTVVPTNILRLMDIARRYRDEIYNATAAGLYIGTDVPIRRMPDRAGVLDAIRNRDVMDSVTIIGTWLGGPQSLQLKLLRKHGVNVIYRDLGIVATEGRFSLPIENNTPTGLLNPFGPCFEFLTTDKQTIVPVPELTVGAEYNLVVTTRNGLYRYDMQDIVRVDGWYHAAPMISFRRKDAGFSAITGEKIHENNVAELLERLGAGRGILIAEADPPHYILCLPSDYAGPDTDHADRLLCDINVEYKETRRGARLGPLEFRIMGNDEFERLDREINPNQDHDRFKRRILVPLPT